MAHFEAYCTNVHPGETLDEVIAVLDRDVAAVKARVAPDRPFGMGLRLGNEVTRALADDAARGRLIDACERNGLYVFTVNGFPYGDFAAASVKEAVYAPDWRDPARLDYTLSLAEVVATLPGPSRRTISTVAGGFGPPTEGAEARDQIGAQLRRAAEGLADLAQRTGVHVRLCLEPEPWTTLETTPQVVEFFAAQLATDRSREFVGVCYDCCHQAVHFEDAAASVRALVEAGITIGKVQVSSALTLDTPADAGARAALLGFAEPRYLHQVVARGDTGLLRALDLPALRDPGPEWLAAEAWRCHFHVPIWWTGDGVLGTSKADWEAAVRATLAHDPEAHLEIETYTWHVLSATEQARLGGDAVRSVAAEFAALRDVVGEGR